MISNTHYIPKEVAPHHLVVGVASASPLILTTFLYGAKELRESQVQFIASLSSIKRGNFKEIILLHDWRKLQEHKEIQAYIEDELQYIRKE